MYAAIDDLEKGNDHLVAAMKSLKNNFIKVNYEDVVNSPETTQLNIYKYLEIEQFFSNELTLLSGKQGDQVGVKKYKQVNKSSIGNWQKVFNTRYRKNILKSYLNQLSEESLSMAGYDKSELLSKVQSHRASFRLSLEDRLHVLFYKTAKYLNGHLLLTKTYSWAKKQYLS